MSVAWSGINVGVATDRLVLSHRIVKVFCAGRRVKLVKCPLGRKRGSEGALSRTRGLEVLHQRGYPTEPANNDGSVFLAYSRIGDDACHLLEKVDVGLCPQ